MKLVTVICGKTFIYETPADLVDQIRPHMQRAWSRHEALKLKAEKDFRKAKIEVKKTRREWARFRKTIEQFSGKTMAGNPVGAGPEAESKTDAV